MLLAYSASIGSKRSKQRDRLHFIADILLSSSCSQRDYHQAFSKDEILIFHAIHICSDKGLAIWPSAILLIPFPD